MKGNIITGYGILTRQEYIDTLTIHLSQNPDKLSRYKYSLGNYTEVIHTDIQTEDIWSGCRKFI